MATYKVRQIVQQLQKLGFVLDENKHHMWRYHYNGEILRVKTMISHSANEINDYLINRMAEQMHLTRAEFMKFANGQLSKKDYIKILKRKNIIKTDK